MQLNHFSLTDSLDELKTKRNVLTKRYHPDKNKSPNATAIMQEINTEYDYVLKHRKEPSKQRPVNNDDDGFLKQAAQNIFHALTHSKGVDYNLLNATFALIKSYQLKPLAEIYLKQYGFQLVNHIQEKVKKERTKLILTTALKLATKGKISPFDFIKVIIKNM